MKIHHIFIILSSLLIASCCSWKYEKEDYEFTWNELDYLGYYKKGDLIYFKSNFGDIDTILIKEIFEERILGSKCGISVLPYHSMGIKIEHLPNDQWKGTEWIEGGNGKISYKTLIDIQKKPISNDFLISVGYKEFIGIMDLSKEEDVKINGEIIPKCYRVVHSYPARIKKSSDIGVVYWTKKFGLTAYTNKNGESWLINN